MKRNFLASTSLIAILAFAPAMSATNEKFPSSRETPSKFTCDGKPFTGPIFKLSQNYQQKEIPNISYPWTNVSFENDWRAYADAVLMYCYKGNILDNVEDSFSTDLWENCPDERKWYHAPWMHWGPKGREFIHGLTMERNSRPGELSNNQTTQFQNWAVAFYNAAGSTVLHKVWLTDPANPSLKDISFPEGSVSFKLLFTEATEKEVPYLKNSPTWMANVYRESASPLPQGAQKCIKPLRLLQLDIAVKDKRSPIGWVFGTFVYNGDKPNSKTGKDAWFNMTPVGLTWGNDPGISKLKVQMGEKLKQQILNDSSDLPPQHLGWAGRLNGPVDNPSSSCLSCHSTAQWPTSKWAPMVPPRKIFDRVENGAVKERQVEYDSADWMNWFRNVKSGEAFTPGRNSLDYSLQLAVGVQNYYEWRALQSNQGGFKNTQFRQPAIASPLNSDAIHKLIERAGQKDVVEFNRAGELTPVPEQLDND